MQPTEYPPEAGSPPRASTDATSKAVALRRCVPQSSRCEAAARGRAFRCVTPLVFDRGATAQERGGGASSGKETGGGRTKPGPQNEQPPDKQGQGGKYEKRRGRSLRRATSPLPGNLVAGPRATNDDELRPKCDAAEQRFGSTSKRISEMKRLIPVFSPLRPASKLNITLVAKYPRLARTRQAKRYSAMNRESMNFIRFAPRKWLVAMNVHLVIKRRRRTTTALATDCAG